VRGGALTLRGTRIQCSLTQGEIEVISTCRETITRSMNDFKRRGLVVQRGTAYLVPNCIALTIYAGTTSTLDSPEPSV